MNKHILQVTTLDIAHNTQLRDALLALNNDNAVALSWLECDRLHHLVAQSFRATRIGMVDAMLLAFDQSADYDSPNFLWFRERYQKFVYVDRVVVVPQARGRGYARKLYRDLFVEACKYGHDSVVCEVNSSPPNPESDAFHAALGFAEVGSGSIHNGTKTVRYLRRTLEK